MQEVSIDYTYDALNRLTSATYSNGTKFAYTYDAAGNVLTYAATHYGLTTTTTYTYDEANQLLSANDPSTGSGQAWTYTYDGSGSLIESDPGAGAANGSTRYTYNTAGYLTKLETYTTEWQTQSEMKYDGLGNRLETTTYTDGVGNTTRYVLDSGATLAATGAESSTFYLNGMGVIGTFDESWSYILQDGAGSTRQLVDTEGAVQLSISYTPWGDTLEVYGSGMLNLGYMGGVYDAGTGLIYMGNGQYYDPSTGRFLTRGMKEESTNPYTPWSSDPAGMLIGPFGFLALLFARKKKHTKLDAIIVVVILLALMGFGSSIAMPVQAAGIADTVSMPVAPRSYAVQAESATVGARMPANPGAPTNTINPSENCIIPTNPLCLQFREWLGQAFEFIVGALYQYVDDITFGMYSKQYQVIQMLASIAAVLFGIPNNSSSYSEAFIEGMEFGRDLSMATGVAMEVFGMVSLIASISTGTLAISAAIISGGSASVVAVPVLAADVALVFVGAVAILESAALMRYIDSSPIDIGGGGGWTNPYRLPDEAIDYAVSNESRLQHAYEHSSELGFGNWNNSNKILWKEYISDILKNPMKTFDNILGKDAVQGFYKVVDGKDVAVFIYKDGKYKGLVATVFELKPNQLIKFGLK